MRRTGLRFLAFFAISTVVGFTQGSRIFSGEVVSIDLTGDIRGFFQAITPVSGFQFTVDPSIQRNLTIHLKNVPWDLALDTVLRTAGLSFPEADGTRLHIVAADPRLGQDHVLMGTTTIEGQVTEFTLQNPRTIIQVSAPGAAGDMQSWRIEWQDAGSLSQFGIKPDTLRAGDQVIITGNLVRPNTMRLVIVRRPSNGFSWGATNVSASAPADGVMFVSPAAR